MKSLQHTAIDFNCSKSRWRLQRQASIISSSRLLIAITTDQEHQDDWKSRRKLSRTSIQNELLIFKSYENNSRSRSDDDLNRSFFDDRKIARMRSRTNAIQFMIKKTIGNFNFDTINRKSVKIIALSTFWQQQEDCECDKHELYLIRLQRVLWTANERFNHLQSSSHRILNVSTSNSSNESSATCFADIIIKHCRKKSCMTTCNKKISSKAMSLLNSNNFASDLWSRDCNLKQQSTQTLS